MNPEIKKQWVAALRSGEYKQARWMLRTTTSKGTVTGHCCLGVLCNLYVRATPGRTWRAIVGTQLGTLPLAVRDWAGLTDANPEFSGVFPEESSQSATELNDIDKLSFAQIADRIEQQL